MNNDHRLLVTIISGFLGSGKTTLMNHLLAGLDRSRVVVIENELGELSIDHDLVLRTDLGGLETVQGRTCCTARQDFLRILHALTESGAKFDRLFIETTGVAHPGMVAHAILADSQLKERLVLDGVVTVVDARHVLDHIGGDGHADEQIAYADLVIINKVDLVTETEVQAVIDRLSKMNRSADYLCAREAVVPADRVLNIGGFDLKRIERGVGGCSKEEGRLHFGPAHEIGTVSVELPGELDADRFRAWFYGFLESHSENLFRSKGIVSVAGIPEQLVFQGVHGLFRLTLGRIWEDGERLTRAVFIGRKLQREEIESGLQSCLASATPALTE